MNLQLVFPYIKEAAHCKVNILYILYKVLFSVIWSTRTHTALPIKRAYTGSLSNGLGRQSNPLAHLPRASPQCSPSPLAHIKQHAQIPVSGTSSQPARTDGQFTVEQLGQSNASRVSSKSVAASMMKLSNISKVIKTFEQFILLKCFLNIGLLASRKSLSEIRDAARFFAQCQF